MDTTPLTTSLLNWLNDNTIQIAITLAVIVVYLAIDRYGVPKLEAGANKGDFDHSVARKAINSARLIIGIFSVLTLVLIWGIDFGSLIIFAGSTITLLGVALFASWSFLSNVTAYFVLLVHPSIRRGEFIRIIEADNFSEGYISELTPLSVKLRTVDDELMIYPNNLLLGRVVIINPQQKLGATGKLPPATKVEEPNPPTV
ncbi:MAG: mechanosensitive ion channel family protein [Pseudomonadales bacterium]